MFDGVLMERVRNTVLVCVTVVMLHAPGCGDVGGGEGVGFGEKVEVE